MVLFLFLGFYAHAQQSTTPAKPKPPVSVIYTSQLTQMSPQKKEYIQTHPEEFTIVADPVAVATTPIVVPVTDPKSPSCNPSRASVEVPKMEATSVKTKISNADFQKMPAEKQQEIMKHAELFEFTD